MQAGVVPVLVAGDRVVGTASNAIKALFEHDVITNGSYSIALDHCVTIEKKYGVFLDGELLKVCDKKEDAEASFQKVQKAIEVIENMEFGKPISFLNLFDHTPMSFDIDEQDSEEKETIRAEL